jgi:hypothetical protein
MKGGIHSMLNEYITFNAAKFVKDYYRYIEIVDGLRAQLNDIDYIRSVPTDADKVQTSPTGDQVEKLVLRRIAIEERIQNYTWHIKTYEKAQNDLLPSERMVLEEFFTSESKARAIDKLEAKGISKTAAYEIRKQALQKIAEAVAGIAL